MSYSPVRHSLYFYNAFDLHVLGTPPAFILSQDQTLHCFLISSSFDSFFYLFFACFCLLFFSLLTFRFVQFSMSSFQPFSWLPVYIITFFLLLQLLFYLFLLFSSFASFFSSPPSSTSSFLLLDTLSFYINSIPFSIKLLKLKWFYTIL